VADCRIDLVAPRIDAASEIPDPRKTGLAQVLNGGRASAA
jgi:hypothetical protein